MREGAQPRRHLHVGDPPGHQLPPRALARPEGAPRGEGKSDPDLLRHRTPRGYRRGRREGTGEGVNGMPGDEYVLDNPTVRSFVANVRETVARSGSPAGGGRRGDTSRLRGAPGRRRMAPGGVPEPGSGERDGRRDRAVATVPLRRPRPLTLRPRRTARRLHPRPRSPGMGPRRPLPGRAGRDRVRAPRRRGARRGAGGALRQTTPRDEAGRLLPFAASRGRRTPG